MSQSHKKTKSQEALLNPITTDNLTNQVQGFIEGDGLLIVYLVGNPGESFLTVLVNKGYRLIQTPERWIVEFRYKIHQYKKLIKLTDGVPTTLAMRQLINHYQQNKPLHQPSIFIY